MDDSRVVKTRPPFQSGNDRPFTTQNTEENRPRWKQSATRDTGSPGRRVPIMDHSLINRPQRKHNESKMHALKSEPVATEVGKAQIFMNNMREKSDHLQNPRYCRVPKVCKALKLFSLKNFDDGHVDCCPLSDPPVVEFDGFEIGQSYTVCLRLQNASNWCQRIRFLKPTSQYFHLHTPEVSFQGRVLAPGSNCDFSLTFLSNEASELKDMIVISSEMDICQLLLFARNPFPLVTVPPFVNMGHCLEEHCSATSFSVTSRGVASTFYLQSINALHPPELQCGIQLIKNCSDILFVPDFIIYPRTFELRANESIDIVILFQPRSVGSFSFQLNIATASGLQWNTLVMAQGTKFQVELQKVDGHHFRPGKADLGLWFGHTTVFSSCATREITVKNQTPMALRFFWKVLNMDDTGLEQSDANSVTGVFLPLPASGVLEAESETSFTFKFTPDNLLLYKHRACLYIDTRKSHPLGSPVWKKLRESLHNPPEMDDFRPVMKDLDNYVDSCIYSTCWDNDHRHITPFFSRVYGNEEFDNKGFIFEVLHIDLSGIGSPYETQIIPPLLFYSDVLLLEKSYTQQVKLTNNSPSRISFSWELVTTPWSASKNLNIISVLPSSGQIEATSMVEVTVTVTTKKIGHLQESVFCKFEGPGGSKQMLQLEGYIQGPLITISPSLLDFGLLQVGTSSYLDLTLSNESGVPANFNLSAVSDHPDPTAPLSLSSGELPMSQSPDTNFLHVKSDFHTKECRSPLLKPENNAVMCKTLIFEPKSGLIPRLCSIPVKVKFSPNVCGPMHCAIACEVYDGLAPKQYALAKAHVTAPEACLIPSKIDLGITYIGKPLKKKAILHNLTGLQISFNWSQDDVGDVFAMNIETEPFQGELGPFGKQELVFHLTPKETGNKEYIAVCEVPGMEYPLGIQFRSYISDIHCSYHVMQPAVALLEQTAQNKAALLTEQRGCWQPLIDSTNIQCLDFGGRCPLGFAETLRLSIRNHSALSGKIDISIAKFGIGLLSQEQLRLVDYILKTPHSSFERIPSDKKHTHLLKDFEDIYWGQSSKKMASRKLEVAMHGSLMKEGNAIAILVHPSCEDVLEPWGEWQCDVVCFSCMPGTYSDVLYCSVGGCPAVEVPIKIGVVGTPLCIRENQIEPGGFFAIGESTSLTLRWMDVPAGSPPRSKKLYVTNASSFDLGIEWQMREPMLDENECSVEVVFEVQEEMIVRLSFVGDPDIGPVHCKIQVEDKVFIQVCLKELLQVAADNVPFQVEPLNQVIPQKSTVPFVATFYTKEVSSFSFELIGRTRLVEHSPTKLMKDVNQTKDFNRIEPGNPEVDPYDFLKDQIAPLHVHLIALTLPPRLKASVDQTLKFHCCGNEAVSHSCYLRQLFLKNEYSYSLSFCVTVSAPFYIVEASSDMGSDGMLPPFSEFVILPNSTLKLTVKFHPDEVILNRCQDMTFDSELLIHFQQMYKQKLFLHAKLVFPEVVAFVSTIWFGGVLTASTQSLPFTITNPTVVDAHWSLTKEQDKGEGSTLSNANCGTGVKLENPELISTDMASMQKSPFTVDLEKGFLPGFSLSEPQRQKIVVTFSPKEPKLYKEVITVVVANGRGCRLAIEGQGILERPPEPPLSTLDDMPQKQQATPRKQQRKKSAMKS